MSAALLRYGPSIPSSRVAETRWPRLTGVSWLRAGWANEANPRFLCENLVSRYRDRRAGKPVLLAGFASQLEHNSRISAKSPFEGDTVVNFDAMVSRLESIDCV